MGVPFLRRGGSTDFPVVTRRSGGTPSRCNPHPSKQRNCTRDDQGNSPAGNPAERRSASGEWDPATGEVQFVNPEPGMQSANRANTADTPPTNASPATSADPPTTRPTSQT